MHTKYAVAEEEWLEICRNYSDDKLLDLPADLLEEFTQKGILIIQYEKITFRADYLFTYFVAKEMNNNIVLFDYITSDAAFYSNYKELVFYGELEGVDNGRLLNSVHSRLSELELEIKTSYASEGIDLQERWESVLVEDSEDDNEHYESTLRDTSSAKQTPETLKHARNRDLLQVDRGRGITERAAVKALESKWYVAMKSYFQMIKHSSNLDGNEKLLHMQKAIESSELFVMSLAAKKDLLCSKAVVFRSGILYFNPLVEIDPEKARRDFKFAAPNSFARVLGDLMANPQLSPAFRRLLKSNSELARYLARHLLLEIPNSENRIAFLEDLMKSDNLVLQTCSMNQLKNKYLGYALDEESRLYYKSMIKAITSNSELLNQNQQRALEKRRMLADMKRNFEHAGRGNRVLSGSH
ncbi:hypothetical protein [Pseudovibrio sp. Ad37]|uniref:STAND family AAA ATPase n=1 Tax=Pseudovibrio sp. Ad37 TaxID=989422 RepID=UPI0007AE56BA|nr:hypothetical protein [Pseudovibrio sp. Ad37]KZL19910.1 hypothetical protein PsAD37_03631 [Pseudovibrio sp. Ad37]